MKLEVLNYGASTWATSSARPTIYANARMDGQPYTSTVINGEDSFSFGRSYAPFTWIRSRADLPAREHAGGRR